MLKAAIFDLDGTLLDSMPYWLHAGEKFLELNGRKPEPNLGAVLWDMNMEEGAWYLKKEYSFSMSVQNICCGINNVLEEAYRTDIQLKTGVKDFLDFLKLCNIPLALCTNTDRKLFMPALERLGVSSYFSAIRTASEEHSSKKSPDMFCRILNDFCVSPKESWLFEDSLYAIKTGLSIGMNVAGIRDDLTEQNEIKKVCMHYFENFEKVKNYFGNLKEKV